MKTTELFVEQTLTGFLVLTTAAAPFLSWDTLQKLLGVIFDRFADTLLERFNRWTSSCSRSISRRTTRRYRPRTRFPKTAFRSR